MLRHSPAFTAAWGHVPPPAARCALPPLPQVPEVPPPFARFPSPRAGRAPRPAGSGGGAAGGLARVSARPRRRRDPSLGEAGRAQLAAPPPAWRSGRYKRAVAAGRPARGQERDGQPPRRGKMLDGPLLARWLAAAFALTLLLAALRPSAAYFG